MKNGSPAALFIFPSSFGTRPESVKRKASWFVSRHRSVEFNEDTVRSHHALEYNDVLSLVSVVKNTLAF